ncbi:MAG TPA: glycosyltransferase family 4 protein [Terriglobales bacterium]|nr:glycosyltransferase family 4 protein [Terriglobales bacterium]
MKTRLLLLTEIIAPYRIPVLNALAARPEIDLHVVFLSETDRTLREWNVYKDEIRFSCEVLPSWRQRIGKYNFLLNAKLSSAFSRFQPQAILCGGYSYIASWDAALWASRNRVPLLLWCESTAHDLRRGHRAVEFLKSRFLKQCCSFVAAGRASSHYLQTLGIPAAHIFTAPNAVDVDFFSRRASEARKDLELRGKLRLPPRFLLFAGRLVTEKGIFELLEAYATLDAELRSEVGLVFAGDGRQRPELLERAKEMLPGRVHWLGFLQREQLAEVYGLAEGVVFPTHSDTWGLVVNEAMSCGLPVITTEVAGCVPDLVEHGWNGFVVPAKAVTRLASAMNELLSNPEKGNEMGRRSAERISNFTPEVWATGVVTAMNSLRTSAA